MGAFDVNRPLKVLLVEDDVHLATMLRMVLPRVDRNLSICESSTLADALKAIKAENPDVVILDLNLPDAKETEALVHIRKEAPLLPIVVLTGYSGNNEGVAAGDIEAMSLQAGAEDFLTKGVDFTPQRLVVAIRHAAIRSSIQKRFQPAEDSLQRTQDALDRTRAAVCEAKVLEKQLTDAQNRPL